MRLENKICIVTAGSTGIGEATARLFIEDGAKVIIANRNAERGEQLAIELGKNAYFFKTDVSDSKSVKNLMDFVDEKFGVLDALFSNAALSISNNIELTTEESWDETFRTNAKGCFMCSKYVLPLLKKSKGASIINTSSDCPLSDAVIISLTIPQKERSCHSHEAWHWNLPNIKLE